MKIVMLTLSGDTKIASAVLNARYPGAEIAALPRSALESGGSFERISALLAEHADVFAVMTEAIDWQYGRNGLLLYGALGGARESLILDSRGGLRAGSRVLLIVASPFRIMGDLAHGWIGVRRARRQLARLEDEIQGAEDRPAVSSSRVDPPVTITYLRTTPAAGTEVGGASSHILGVVNALLETGMDVSFISNDDIAGLDKGEVTFKKVIPPEHDAMPRSAFEICNSAAFAARASDVIVANPPDFIYERYSRFSYAGVMAAQRARVPLFLEYNGSEVWMAKHWGRGQLGDVLERCERLNLDAATRIFVVSEVERDNLLTAGVAANKIVVNPNGVDADEFRPNIGGEAERKALGISDATTLVGFVGSFGPWHGLLALADAIALTPKGANIHFLLVGAGSMRQEVENKLRASLDIDRVTFTGVVTHDRVPVLLDACDILISPHIPLADGSAFFGSPTKLFEYMAMGKGIVASRLGQIGDVLSDGETALLVEPGNVRELSAAMVKLASGPGIRKMLGESARRTALEKHTWKMNAARVIAEYKALVSA